MKANNQSMGQLGERLAARFLEKKGYEIIRRNWRVKLGELDLIAKKNTRLIFIEVKCIFGKKNYYPEDKITRLKAERLRRLALIYLAENQSKDIDYQIDIVAVEINPQTQQARLRHYPNAI